MHIHRRAIVLIENRILELDNLLVTRISASIQTTSNTPESTRATLRDSIQYINIQIDELKTSLKILTQYQ